MKIGIISDTHDNLDKINKAVSILNSKKVEFVVHCGDFVAPFSVKPLFKLKCDWLGVFGNNDGEKKGLLTISEDRIKKPPYEFSLSSKKILVMHDLKEIKKNVDIVLYGHTHKLNIEKINKFKKDILLINPGETCGWVYNKSSLVILDLKSLLAQPVYF